MPFSVLLVDDEPVLLEFFRDVFQMCRPHWSVICVTTAEEAITRLTASPVDVMITDLNLPGQKGDVLMEQVIRKFPRVRRVLFTGGDETCPHAEVVLRKPCRTTVLLDTLDRLHAESETDISG